MSARVRTALLVLVIAIVVAATQVVSVPKGAADATGSDGHGTVRVGASNGESGNGHSGAHGSESSAHSPGSCVYEPAPAYLAQELGVGGSLPGEWLLFGCPGFDLGMANSGAIVWMNVVWVTYALQKSVTADLADEAESSVTLPSPVIETDPSGTTFVNLATWLWVSPSVWHPFTATATAGGVSATATATPVRVEFTTGDGGKVTCNGPGTPYDLNESSSSQTTVCSHIYRSSSANQESPDGNPNDAAYVVTATITWSVTWKAVGATGGGNLPPLTTTSTARLRVEQIESVNLP
ncbi:MAG: hypothetical protein ACLP6E_02165 [Acidimicrobiales bacterium]